MILAPVIAKENQKKAENFIYPEKKPILVKKKVAYPDHHEFTISELEEIIQYSYRNNLQPITTEKDYYRIKKFGIKNLDYLKIDLEIFEKEKFIKKIMSYL